MHGATKKDYRLHHAKAMIETSTVAADWRNAADAQRRVRWRSA